MPDALAAEVQRPLRAVPAMKTRSTIAGFVLGTLLSAVVVAITWGVVHFRSASAVTLDSTSILHDIQALHELVSVKYTIQKAVGLEEQKRPVGTEKILLLVQADVLAGVDLSKIRRTDLQVLPDHTIRLALPAPAVEHVVIDDTRTKVWDHQITWWTPWVPYNKDLERQARLAAIKSIEADAVSAGILDQAKRNASTTIHTFLQTLGVKAILTDSNAEISSSSRPRVAKS